MATEHAPTCCCVKCEPSHRIEAARQEGYRACQRDAIKALAPLEDGWTLSRLHALSPGGVEAGEGRYPADCPCGDFGRAGHPLDTWCNSNPYKPHPERTRALADVEREADREDDGALWSAATLKSRITKLCARLRGGGRG